MRSTTNLKQGEAVITIEYQEDLWYISHILDPGNRVKAKTERKIKLGGEGEKAKVMKKTLTLEISAETAELSGDTLRINGKVTEGPEDIPKGSYHAIALEPGMTFKLTKDSWKTFQLQKLKEACEEKISPLLALLHDREEAIFALVKKQGFEVLTHLKGKVEKKAFEQHGEDFYSILIKQLEEYQKRYHVEKIILASPAFFKDHVLKILPDYLKKMTIPAVCHSVSAQAVNEVLQRDETKQAVQEIRMADELKAVEKVLETISKDGAVTYGFKETKHAADAGAVEELLVTDGFISKRREEGNYDEVDKLLSIVDQMKGKIHIIDSDLESGKKLDGLGGIASLLRYKLSY